MMYDNNEQSAMILNEVRDFDLKKVRWNYLAEGGCHLIISIPDKRLILRFRKYAPTNFGQQRDIEEDEKSYRVYYDYLFFFHYTIMVPLFGRAYSILPLISRIDEVDLNERLTTIDCSSKDGPATSGKIIPCGFVEIYPNNTFISSSRLKNGPLNPESFVSTASDYLRQLAIELTETNENNERQRRHPVLAVEIKPKQGWIPLSDRKLPKCIFCTHQYTKLVNGSIRTLSKYCPLDLFSGDTNRMKSAIKNLLETPQNNMAIFKDGQIVYSERQDYQNIGQTLSDILSEQKEERSNDNNDDADDLLEKFVDLTVQALNSFYSDDRYADFIRAEKPYPASLRSTTTDYTAAYKRHIALLYERFVAADQTCNWSYRTTKNTVVGKILRIQQLDQVGLNDVLDHYRRTNLDKSIDDSYRYVSKLMEQRYRPYEKLTLNSAELYALSSVAKDCSIFVTFQKVSTPSDFDNRSLLNWKDEKYVFDVALSDIGPKPLTCIDKHVKRNINMIKDCCKYFNLIT